MQASIFHGYGARVSSENVFLAPLLRFVLRLPRMLQRMSATEVVSIT
jgi:hypothetical protein